MIARARVTPTCVVPVIGALCIVLGMGRVPAVQGKKVFMGGGRSVEDRVVEFGEAVRRRLQPCFDRIEIPYPPTQLSLLGFKHEKRLEVWVKAERSVWKLLKTYPILAASGTLGPKLREGDQQVPEGIYAIELLNPNSRFHLSLRVSYPNAFDREQARRDGRTRPGSDIMIHGKNCSVGCLAMGDSAAEELFIMAALCGIGNIRVIISPVDFRIRAIPVDMPDVPLWTSTLYDSIRQALTEYQTSR